MRFRTAAAFILVALLYGQALAQNIQCLDGENEALLVLPNGMEKTLCIPAAALQGLENNDNYVPVELSTEKKVFVTSALLDGKLGGLRGANAICQRLADKARLSGSYKAWLSDDTDSPAGNSLTPGTFTQSTLPYKLVDGTLIADDWNDLVNKYGSTALYHEINMNQLGIELDDTNTAVWTNTRGNGEVSDASASCEQWRSARSDILGNAGFYTETVGSLWTDTKVAGNRWCDALARLYCFEQ